MGLFSKKNNETSENCCPHCGAALDEDSLFCTECGNAVEIAASSTSGVPAVEESQKPCPECGTMVDDDSNFCWSCGHVFETLLNRCAECNAILPDDVEVCTLCGKPTGKVIPKPVSTPKTSTTSVEKPISSTTSASSTIEESTASLRSLMGRSSGRGVKEEEIQAAERNFHKPSAL